MSTSERGIGSGNNKRCVISPPANEHAPVADVKKEGAVVEEVAQGNVDLSSTAMWAYQVLERGLKFVCLGYIVSLQRQLEALEQYREDILEELQASAFESLYH